MRLKAISFGLARHAFRESHQGQALFAILDGVKCPQQLRGMRFGKHFSYQAVDGLVAAVVFLAEECADRYAENGGNLFETAASHTIGAAFVFLNLLERHAEHLAERRLREALTQPIGADPLPYAHINRLDVL